MIELTHRAFLRLWCDDAPDRGRDTPESDTPEEQRTCDWPHHGDGSYDTAKAKRLAKQHVKDTGHLVVTDRIVRTVLERQNGD